MSDEFPATALTAKIVAAFARSNSVAAAELPTLINSVHNALAKLGEPVVEVADEAVKPSAAQIRKSITPDALISFVDGKGYKTLKRHLTRHGLTTADYKAKFGLPKDYPTTAQAYSEKRSAMAKSLGLGRKVAPAPGSKVPSVKRGRAKKVAT